MGTRHHVNLRADSAGDVNAVEMLVYVNLADACDIAGRVYARPRQQQQISRSLTRLPPLCAVDVTFGNVSKCTRRPRAPLSHGDLKSPGCIE